MIEYVKNKNGVLFKKLVDNSYVQIDDVGFGGEYEAWVIANGQPLTNEDLEPHIYK